MTSRNTLKADLLGLGFGRGRVARGAPPTSLGGLAGNSAPAAQVQARQGPAAKKLPATAWQATPPPGRQPPTPTPFRAKAALLLLVPLLCAGRGATEQPAGRAAVGKCVSADATIFRREAPDKPWQVVKQGEALHGGDLLLGLPGAALDSRDGSIRLTFACDLGHGTPLPVVETAVLLHADKDADLDFTLDGGRVEFANRKDKGEARVVSRVRDARAETTLGPGAVCSLGVFGRWPAGVPFRKDAKADHAPTLHLSFLVLKGEATLNLSGTAHAMRAPPGPATIEWDSVHGADPSPTKLDQLPEWAVGDDRSEKAKQRRALLDEFRQTVLKKSMDGAVDGFLNSDDRAKRRFAINFLAATDNLGGLAVALSNAKHADVWESGVLALRHWIGRGPGQDQKLYEKLVKTKGYTAVDAEAVMQLLHGFGEAEVASPELYEMLIDYQGHENLAIRALANWHLVRLAPAGKPIGYDPLAPKAARDKAVAAWRKLIPPGSMPPPEKP